MRMKPPEPPAPHNQRGADILVSYRERIMYLIAIAGVVFLTPFSINDFIQGRYTLGFAILGVVLGLGIDALAIHYKKRPPIPFGLLVLPAAGAIALSLIQQGFYGALWSYPAVLFCYFVLPRRMANLSSFALLGMSTTMIYFYISGDVALRFLVSLLLTIVIINIILNIVSELQRELLDQAITDPLTGAYNRRHVEAALDEAMERSRRTGAAASVLLIDIDHFKRVNDELGHGAGDRVLKELVRLINTRSRRLDKLFRMGGEEFLLFLPDTPVASAMIQAESLRKLIADSLILQNRPITVSIGLSAYQDDQHQSTWIKRADDALYRAKESGRNRVVSADEASPSSVMPDSEPDTRRSRQR